MKNDYVKNDYAMRHPMPIFALFLLVQSGGCTPCEDYTNRGEEEVDPLGVLASHPPVVSKIEVELASPEPTELAKLFITYADPLSMEEIPLQLGRGETTMLNDAGQWPDEEPGDGVFSGMAPVDLALEAELASRYLDRVGHEGAPMSPRFEGRHMAGVEPFDPRPFEQRTELGNPEQVEALVGRRLVLFDAQEQVPFALPASPYAPTHDWEKTLLVRDLTVVEDVDRTNVWSDASGTCEMVGNPNGEWAFQTLMENIANPAQTGISLDDFVSHWVLHWGDTHDVQGDIVPAQGQGLHDLWHGNSSTGSAGWPKIGNVAGNYNDTLDMDRAPFRLTAIVNRVDLRGGGVYGGTAGELRFIFEMIDPVTCEPRPFNVILEFGVPGRGCDAILDWGNEWYELDQHALGGLDYNGMLSDITTRVTSPGVAPDKPNGSAIKQIRTNDQVMVWPHYDLNWQLREFRIDAASGYLEISPLVQTPAVNWEVPAVGTGIALIDDYIASNVGPILAGTHEVGPSWGGQSPFQGGYSGYGRVGCWRSPCTGPIPYPSYLEERGLWWGTEHSGTATAERAARHEFSLATCNGCHGREAIEDATAGMSVPSATPDQPFRHVEGHGPGTMATLSRFLTGTHQGCNTATNMLVPPLGPASNDCTNGCCPIGDPVHSYTSDQVHFSDLLRRQADLDALVSSSCLMSLTADHHAMTH